MKNLKKLLALMLVFTLLIPSFPTKFKVMAETPKAGDVNDDGSINSTDALCVLRHAAKLDILQTEQFTRADVNSDGHADAKDALLILKYAAKLINSFPLKTAEPTEEPTKEPKPTPTAKPTIEPTPTVQPTPEVNAKFSKTVWIVGDSIAAYHDKDGYERPLYGWGELIPDYYSKEIVFNNMAVSSQSSRSYINQRQYNDTFNKIGKDDYVIISFGHNDHNTTGGTSRVTDPEGASNVYGSFKYYLKKYYIDPALEKGAVPILMSSVVRCFYDYNDNFNEEAIHLKYAVAMQELVNEYAAQGITVFYIDATTYTYNLYSTLTREEAMLYHGLGKPSWGEWYQDTTHYSREGAEMICDFIVSGLSKLPLDINNYLVSE